MIVYNRTTSDTSLPISFNNNILHFSHFISFFIFIMSSSGSNSVSSALKTMRLSKEVYHFINDYQENWSGFGKKDSHILRAALMTLFKKEKMSPDAIFMTYFLHSVVKNNVRISRAMERFPEDTKKAVWYAEVKQFLEKRLTMYTSQETTEKFASVHLPSTNPGLDCLCAAMAEKVPDNKKEVEEAVERIIGRQTFAQLNINKALQAENMAHVRNFWDNTIKQRKVKSNRKARNTQIEEEGFQEEYYETSAADTYNIVDLNLTEMEANSRDGYSKGEILEWFLDVKGFTEKQADEVMGEGGVKLETEEDKKARLEKEIRERVKAEIRRKEEMRDKLKEEMLELEDIVSRKENFIGTLAEDDPDKKTSEDKVRIERGKVRDIKKQILELEEEISKLR